jgi:hypothetical protein
MSNKKFNICDKARIKQYNPEASGFSTEGKTIRARIVPRIMNRIVVIVDYSDSHGLCYRVVAPNFNGNSGRDEELEFVWVDPDELEEVK